MEIFDKDLVLKEAPFFSGLSEAERQIVRERCSLRGYKKDQVIYREGELASGFYCVIWGRVVVYASGPGSERSILEYLHRGKYFGIISLLTGDPHSVTAQAVNDCLLLVIKKEDFDFILRQIPALAMDLSRTLSRRLKNKDARPKKIFESTVIAVFSSHSQAGKSLYALNLGLSLIRETGKSLVIVDICPQDKGHSLPQRMGIEGTASVFDISGELGEGAGGVGDFILKSPSGPELACLHYSQADTAALRKLINVLSILLSSHHYIILDLPSLMDELVFGALNQSDTVHLLTSPEPVELKRTQGLIGKLKKDFAFQPGKINVIVNEYKFARITHAQQVELLGSPVFATLPHIEAGSADRLILEFPECEYSRAVRRISRQVGGCLVGLALGVGVGYGFCHIGVLKVIEEEHIPVDVISGASMGAVIAALWATGRSSSQILEIVSEFRESKSVWGLADFTFPALGFIKGRRLYRVLKKFFGEMTFYDVRLPLKIIASDIRRKEARILDQGKLADALMLSCSMPGVFQPFMLSDGMIVDGGMINPLPTEILFQMGLKKIIAVNVTPSKEDMLRHYARIKEGLARTYEAVKKRKWFDLKAYFKEKFRINILDIIFSSIEVMQSELISKEAQLADVVLHPDTAGLHWLELNRYREFALRGEEEARRNLDKIWKVVNEEEK